MRDQSKRRHNNPPTKKVRAKYAGAGISLPEPTKHKGRLPAKGELVGLLERMYIVQYSSALEVRLVPVPDRMRAMAEEIVAKMEEKKATTGEDHNLGAIEQYEMEDRKEAGL